LCIKPGANIHGRLILLYSSFQLRVRLIDWQTFTWTVFSNKAPQ